ncbi:chorismate mutase [Aestuariispira insulae]|uniref:chorismate mutase n=1 Tax=Aestuariispira insulae TaxID=1461337 RepID=A0A3D9HQI2_9PROT|nr:chorismate mutase [Aestuariispira insulae]RED51571.1 chorismate mutase [Aestuariispira insulae]
MSNRSLDDLRREIDEIDDAIHELIMKRADVVQHVAAAKGIAERNDLPIRPAREAAMLRRLAAHHRDPFPFEALARIWQEMIAAFTQIQNQYSIAVYVDDDHQSMWDLARDQFGAQTPITAFPSTREALAQVFEGRAGVAVLPLPTVKNMYPWWTALAVANAPKVISRLPFAGVGNVRGTPMEALAVASIPLQPTGRDRTLLVIESTDQMSHAGLEKILKAAKLNAVYTTSADVEGWMNLVELDEYLEADDPRLEMLEVRDSIQRTHIIGHYADVIRSQDFRKMYKK